MRPYRCRNNCGKSANGHRKASAFSDRTRAATVLYVVLQAIDNLKTLFTPFLPFSSQVTHELLGNEGAIAGRLEFREVEEEGGERHVVLTGDYDSWVGQWAPSKLPPNQPLPTPRPLFAKLDPENVVEDELRRMDERARGEAQVETG